MPRFDNQAVKRDALDNFSSINVFGSFFSRELTERNCIVKV